MPNPISWLVDKFKAGHNKFELKKEQSTPYVSQGGSPCCDALVHIAYRGVSDDRLYLTYDKKWQDVKFFRPKGLRVYCQKCRRRIL